MTKIKIGDLPVNEELDTEDTKTTLGGQKWFVADSFSFGVRRTDTDSSSSTRGGNGKSIASIDDGEQSSVAANGSPTFDFADDFQP